MFITGDQQFHSSIYTQEKHMHTGPGRHEQGGMWWQHNNKYLEATRMSHNHKHGSID